MNEFCMIQIFKNQQWIDCALVELLDVTTLGWEAPTRTSYLF